MKLKYAFIAAAIVIMLFLGVYYFMPRAPIAFKDIKPRLVELPAFTVTGFEIYGNLAKGDYPKAWQKISNIKHEIDASCQEGFTYGIELYQKKYQTKWHYLAGCEMSAPFNNLAEKRKVELSSRVIPKNLYVVFTYRGDITLKRMGGLYGYIFNEWLPNNGYQRAGFYNFERYDERFLGAKDQGSEFELFVPIRKITAQ